MSSSLLDDNAERIQLHPMDPGLALDLHQCKEGDLLDEVRPLEGMDDDQLVG